MFKFHITAGDFNMKTDDTDLKHPIVNNNYHNLIKAKTCFKSVAGKCTDLVLANRKLSFKNTGSVNTGLSDFHHMIYTSMVNLYLGIFFLENILRGLSKLQQRKLFRGFEKIFIKN